MYINKNTKIIQASQMNFFIYTTFSSKQKYMIETNVSLQMPLISLNVFTPSLLSNCFSKTTGLSASKQNKTKKSQRFTTFKPHLTTFQFAKWQKEEEKEKRITSILEVLYSLNIPILRTQYVPKLKSLQHQTLKTFYIVEHQTVDCLN